MQTWKRCGLRRNFTNNTAGSFSSEGIGKRLFYVALRTHRHFVQPIVLQPAQKIGTGGTADLAFQRDDDGDRLSLAQDHPDRAV